MALPSNARNFPYQATRIGSVASKFFFTVKCSRCTNTRTYEATKVVPDEVVNKFFARGGWVLGRNRQNDICPTCLGVKPENQLASRFKVVESGERVPSTGELVAEAHGKRKTDRKVTEKALEALFKPKPVTEPEAQEATPEAPQVDPTAAHVIRLEHRLDTMTKEISEVRAGVELVVESVDTMTRATQQQTEAIARAAGTIGRASEGISSMLQGLITLVKEIRDQRPVEETLPALPRLTTATSRFGLIANEIVLPETGLTTLGLSEQPKVEAKAETSAPEPSPEPQPELGELPELDHGKLPPLEPLPDLPEPPIPVKKAGGIRRRTLPEPVAPVPPPVRVRHRPGVAAAPQPSPMEKVVTNLLAKAAPEPKVAKRKGREGKLAVYSNPDLTKERETPRYYTTISIPRRVWDLAGFGGDHRVWLYEAAGTIRIERVSKRTPNSGQVIKKFTDNVVRLQTTKFGQIAVPKPTAVVENGQIVIHGIQ